MRIDILGRERRRRWTDEQKREIVMSVGIDGATVTEIAQRHDVTRQQIYTWRCELRKKALLGPSTSAVFVPLEMRSVEPESCRHDRKPFGLIELRLTSGRSLCFGSGLDGATLTRIIRAVEAA